MNLKISKSVSLPIDVVTEKIAWLGRTGSGKTYGAQKSAELMYDAGAQFVALDNVGVWPSLRMGTKALDVPVFGGLYADLPLEPTGGALVADVIVDRGISAIVDTSQFLPSEHVRFCTDFATQFFQRKKTVRSAVHLYLEECQEVVPQNPQKGEERMLHAFQRLWKLGRNFGIGGSLISQRPQEVNKKALNMSEILFAFQMTGPQERKAIEGWVADKGLDVDIVDTLPKLDVGQPHVWSPRLLKVSEVIQILPKRTFDLSSTPKVGENQKDRQPLKPVDLEKLRGQMAATIENAKANDPKNLKERIRQLESDLKKAQTNTRSTTTRTTRVEQVPILDKEAISTLKTVIANHLTAIQTSFKGVDREIREQSNAIYGAFTSLEKATKKRIADIKATPSIRFDKITEPFKPSMPTIVKVNGKNELHVTEAFTGGSSSAIATSMPKMQRAILSALAQYPDGRSYEQILTLTGYRHSGSTITAKAELRRNGWMTGTDALLQITPEGSKALGPFEKLPTGDDLIEHWKAKLSKMESAFFSALVDHRGDSITYETLLDLTGYKHSGSTITAKAVLRKLDLMVGKDSALSLNEAVFS